MGRARAPEGVLLERGEALEMLESAGEAALAGAGSVVVVHGAAGLGKTRLLEECAARLDSRGVRVLSMRGVRVEREFGFGLVRQLFDPVFVGASQRERARLFAGAAAVAEPLFGGGETAPEATGFGTLNGLWWLLATLALDGPLALLADDVHWADDASARWLAFLAHRVGELPVLVVAAGRSDEPGAPAEWAGIERVAARTIELAPLTSEAVGELLAAGLAAEPAPEFASACHLATRGNPFLVTELVRELRARGIAPTRDEAITVASVAPEGVARSIRERLDARPAEVGRLSRAVAVLGDGVRLAYAADLAELDDESAAAAAASLVELGILRRAETLTFEHPIVRDAVYESIVPVVRGGMHRRAADVLALRGEDPERQAAQLLAAEPAGDGAVVEVLRAAARSAVASGAHDAAARYLSRAVAEPPPAADRGRVLLELGEAEMQFGGPASEHLRLAMAAEDPEVATRAAAALARWSMLTGDVDSAIAVAGEHGARVGQGPERLTVETELIAAASLAGADVWARLSDRLRSLAAAAAAAGDDGLPLLALLATDEIRRGGSRAIAGDLALAALEGDVLLARGPDYPPFLHAVYGAIRGGRIEEAQRVLARATVLARERGSLLGYCFAACYRGMAHCLRSELDAGEAELRGALEAARDNGWTMLEWQALGMYLIAVPQRGELEAGQAELERGGYEGELPSVPMATGLLSGRATLRYAQGRWREAYEDFVACGRSEGPYSERSQIVWWRADAAMALAHLGERSEALALADAELELQRGWGDEICIGRALHARGLAKGERGIDDLERAAETLTGVYDAGLAACLIDLGAALRRMKRRTDSRPPLRRAIEIAERIGARRYAELARAELAASGARARSVVRTGVDALTPSELRIAGLAADGLSNPEIAQSLFVTRKTVETHMASIFLKLGIASRTALPRALGRPA